MFPSSQTAQSERPKAVGGGSRSEVVAATSTQSPPGPWRLVICDGFCRRIQKTHLKCSDSRSLSTSILETAFFEKVSNLKTFLGDFLAFIDGATAPRKNGVNRACGHFGGLLCFSKLFLGASSGSRSALREGKFAGPGSLEFVAVRRTGRLHIYRVGGRIGRLHFVNMQLICSAHGAF